MYIQHFEQLANVFDPHHTVILPGVSLLLFIQTDSLFYHSRIKHGWFGLSLH